MTSEDIKHAVQQVKQDEAKLIDVRTDLEWNQGHARDALHFDSKRMEAGELPNLEKDKPVYLYCRSGGRAGRMKTILQNAGFKEVYNLGGLLDWQEAGGEVERRNF